MDRYPFPRTGDIALMSANPKVLAAQIATRGRLPKFSHAALTIDDHSYVDSLTKRGIGIARWADFPPSMPIRVFRHIPSAERAHERLESMLDHYGKAYNFVFALKDKPVFRERFGDAYYCTEFVAKVYTLEELGLSDSSRRTILPVDLEALAGNPNWCDVTKFYLPYINGTISPSSDANARLFESQGELQIELRKQQKVIAGVDELSGDLSAVMRNLSDLLEGPKK